MSSGPVSKAAVVTAVAAAALAPLAQLPAAHADTACYNHCYALTTYTAWNTGEGVDLNSTCQWVTSSNDFVSWEMWDGTNGSNGQYGSPWVEVGLNYGHLDDDTHGNSFQWFWADNHSGGYWEHYVGSGNTGWDNVTVSSQRNGTWNVIIAGNTVGYSTNNGTNGTDGQAGAETTTSGANLNAYTDNFQYHGLNQWHGVSPNISTAASGWGPFYSRSAYAGSVTGSASHVTGGSCSSMPVKPAVPQNLAASAVPSRVRAVATALSTSNGDRSPASIIYARSTRAKSLALYQRAGNIIGDTATYTIQVRGSFNGHAAHVPKGYKPPTGNLLSIIISAKTGAILDWSITGGKYALASLGAVTQVK